MSNLCIIPARGGSKRIPRKNIKDFLGKPIIAYTIEAAIKSNLFNEIMVSTDDKEIAKVAMSFGANVPFMRSKKNANDFATTYEVIEEVIKEYKNKGKKIDNICCIYPCAPFVTSSKISAAYDLFIKKKYDSVLPIMPFSFPIQRAIKLNDDKIKMFNEAYKNTRTQDLEKSYHDAGQFYWMKTETILIEKSIVTNNSGAIIISEMEGQDIDNETDWKLAELKYKMIK